MGGGMEGADRLRQRSRVGGKNGGDQASHDFWGWQKGVDNQRNGADL